jgi:hypothetical protein
MGMLAGKKVIIIGDRDGIPGQAIEACAKAPAPRLCSPRRSASSERPQVQWIWKIRSGSRNSPRSMVRRTSSFFWALLRARPLAWLLRRSPMVTRRYAGPLTGVQLGLRVYHVCEPEIKAEFDPAVYEEQVSMMEMVLDVDDICKRDEVHPRSVLQV